LTELIAAGGCWNANRFALDEAGGATRNWLAAIETSVQMTTAQQLILACNFDGDDMNIATNATFKIQWRNVSDAGSWTDLGTTGDIRYASSSLQMTNNAALVTAESACNGTCANCTGKGWTVFDVGSKERVNANGITQTVDDDEWFELQWAVDLSFADGLNGDEYEFRVTQSDNTVIGTGLGKITVVVAGKIDLVTRNEDRSAVEGSVKVTAYLSDGGSPAQPIGEPITSGTSNGSGVLSLTGNIASGEDYILVGGKGTGGTVQSDASPPVTAVDA